MASQWVADSLDAGMQVIWLERARELLFERVARAGVDWERAVGTGQLKVASPDAFLALSGPGDIPGRIAAGRDLVGQALAAGYEGVSVGVESSDALSVMADVATQLAFEVAWEEFTREHRLWLLCLYGPAADPSHVQTVIPLHPREMQGPDVCARLDPDGISLTGQVDVSNSHLVRSFAAAAAGELGDQRDGRMTIDLSGASFVDLHGTRELVELQRVHPERRLRVVNPPDSMRRILELPGWRSELDLVEVRA